MERAISGLMVMAVMVVMLIILPGLIPQANAQNKHRWDNKAKDEIDCQIRHDVTSLFN